MPTAVLFNVAQKEGKKKGKNITNEIAFPQTAQSNVLLSMTTCATITQLIDAEAIPTS